MRAPDLLERFKRLVELQNDPNLINLDGVINPYQELAAEYFEIPRSRVSFEQQNYMIKTLKLEIDRVEMLNDMQRKFGSRS